MCHAGDMNVVNQMLSMQVITTQGSSSMINSATKIVVCCEAAMAPPITQCAPYRANAIHAHAGKYATSTLTKNL
jgi:hypothetical protein